MQCLHSRDGTGIKGRADLSQHNPMWTLWCAFTCSMLASCVRTSAILVVREKVMDVYSYSVVCQEWWDG